MSWLSNFFGGFHGGGIVNANPANSAMDYLNQIPGQYGQPSEDLYNKIASGYQQSPGYQFKLDQARQAGNNASAAGGMLGSNQHQFLAGQAANDIANQDFEQYFKNRMGIGDTLGNVYGQKAQYGYAGQAGQNQQHQALIGQLLSLLGIGGAYGLNKWG